MITFDNVRPPFSFRDLFNIYKRHLHYISFHKWWWNEPPFFVDEKIQFFCLFDSHKLFRDDDDSLCACIQPKCLILRTESRQTNAFKFGSNYPRAFLLPFVSCVFLFKLVFGLFWRHRFQGWLNARTFVLVFYMLSIKNVNFDHFFALFIAVMTSLYVNIVYHGFM